MDQERRNQSYSFTSERDLIKFFSKMLPREVVSATIALMRQNFVKRGDTDKEEDELQLLKKCECELIRVLKKEKENADQGLIP